MPTPAKENENENEKGRAVAAPSSTQLAALRQLGDAAVSLVAAHPRGNAEPLLRMQKGDGSWLYGADETEVEEGSEWAINPLGCRHGWIAWATDPKAKVRKLGEIMVPITSHKPDEMSLAELADGSWSEQLSLQLKCINGEDVGLQCQFKSNSLGGVEACLEIIAKIGDRIRGGESAVVPIVQLEHSSYQHPSYGKVNKPVIKILRWVDMDGDGRQEPKPEPEPQPTNDAGEPVRRRRRANA